MSYERRRPLARALADVEAFENLLRPVVVCERWVVCGSVRRQCADVGDIDVVAVPKIVDIPGSDMFHTMAATNALWHRVDALVAAGTMARHVRDTKAGDREHWGPKCRAIEFRGSVFEVNLADLDNFGVLVAVKTGPAELSEYLVTRIKQYGYASRQGFYIWDTGSEPPRMMENVTEAQFFGFAGLAMPPPEKRFPPKVARR